MTTDKQIAMTIIDQMGGVKKVMAFTGAKQFGALDNGVTFKFKMNPKMNFCRITLNEMDTYNMEFLKLLPIPKFTMDQDKNNKAWERMEASNKNIVVKIDGLYNDMIKSTFEETTGLYLSF